MNKSCFDPIEDVIQAFSSGEIVVMVDDEGRENEGDLICAAELVTPDIINFMITHARGLVCVPMTEDRLRKLGLSRMTPAYSSDKYHTAFMDSVDVRENTTTGISAFDRAETIKALISEKSSAQDFIKPGHVFPLKSVNNGVVERPGHTEGTVDLAKICKLKPAGVICEILNEDGSMMRLNGLIDFAKKHSLKITSVDEIVKYRQKNEEIITPLRQTIMPTKFGKFKMILYDSKFDKKEHLALIVEKNNHIPPLVRIHSECLTGDVFGSSRCDCGQQLEESMKKIQDYGHGAIIYLRQEGRGIGLSNKLHAYELQDKGFDTVEANLKLGFKADERDYALGAKILKNIKMCDIRLLTNNPAKENGLTHNGIRVIERIPIVISSCETNSFYLKTKKEKMGHYI
ncbi:MAG: bifunctional 3,4-dihydroxy-2-butanone-4-phosphate synthase/GTP cyclohydrolase II [Kiritimatiellaceae bacterium]|nr:bifunctional 3,4-dihydroxy-2-butanone-4-phosphate synthase/GTP cyclohydrolase II [Kiritimatiellaceae bacterium]